MAFYENVFIARQDIAPTQVDELRDTMTKIITDGKGQVTKHEYWGLRNLAYPMQKNKKGHYVLLNIEADGNVIAELERRMRLNEDVVRYLTVKVEQLDPAPSAIIQQMDKGQKDELEEAQKEPEAPRKKPTPKAAAEATDAQEGE